MSPRKSSTSREVGGDFSQLLTDGYLRYRGQVARGRPLGCGRGGRACHAYHTAGVQSFAVIFDEPLDWTAFGVWASMLLHRHGADILRQGTFERCRGAEPARPDQRRPALVDPPSHLEAWPDADRRSRLVFIVRGLQRARIERSLAIFNGLINKPASPGRPRDGGDPLLSPGYRQTPPGFPMRGNERHLPLGSLRRE